MKAEGINYFCNGYLIMLDYDQTLEQVIEDYNRKETNSTKQKLKEELTYVLALPQNEKKKLLENIIMETIYFDIKEKEFEDILIQLDRSII